MRDSIELQSFWRQHAGQPLALCTIIRKHQSGYRAVGAKKIIAREGGACGLLSGGCLEGDIEAAGRDRWNEMPFIASFSTMDETDRLLGYQIGCAGIIDILFEPLPATVDNMDLYLPFGDRMDVKAIAISLAPATLGQRKFVRTEFNSSPEEFIDPWLRPLHLFVLGCGPDAPAFAELATPLGWRLRFLDYRSHYSLPEKFKPLGAEIFPIAHLTDAITAGDEVAIIVMTHNYEADLAILAQLAGRPFGYVGCLGPRERYEQLKADLQSMRCLRIDPAWEKIVHAPAGIIPKGRGPQEIALSVIAQIQSIIGRHERN